MKRIGPRTLDFLERLRAGIKSEDWQPTRGNPLPFLIRAGLATYSMEIKGWLITERGRALLESRYADQH